jgi:hypothetical protein
VVDVSLTQSLIDVFPMTYVQDRYLLLAAIDFVDAPIVSCSDSPPFPTGKLMASIGAWPLASARIASRILGQSSSGMSANSLLSLSKNGDGVAHWCLCSISLIASSKGISASPDALAAS